MKERTRPTKKAKPTQCVSEETYVMCFMVVPVIRECGVDMDVSRGPQ